MSAYERNTMRLSEALSELSKRYDQAAKGGAGLSWEMPDARLGDAINGKLGPITAWLVLKGEVERLKDYIQKSDDVREFAETGVHFMSTASKQAIDKLADFIEKHPGHSEELGEVVKILSDGMTW